MAEEVITPRFFEEGDLVIPFAAFPYAVVQSGALDHLRHEPGDFAYEFNRLQEVRLATIKPFLPPAAPAARRILDVGGGLGAVDVLIAREYSPPPAIWLLDGVGAKPVVERHDAPFNDMEVSAQFLEANGAALAGFWSPVAALTRPEAHYRTSQGFDLVVSFDAWGFHIEPGMYADVVHASMKSGARLIADVRRGKPWREQFERWFRFVDIAEEGLKHERIVFERP
jgi:hypothetical protein